MYIIKNLKKKIRLQNCLLLSAKYTTMKLLYDKDVDRNLTTSLLQGLHEIVVRNHNCLNKNINFGSHSSLIHRVVCPVLQRYVNCKGSRSNGASLEENSLFLWDLWLRLVHWGYSHINVCSHKNN